MLLLHLYECRAVQILSWIPHSHTSLGCMPNGLICHSVLCVPLPLPPQHLLLYCPCITTTWVLSTASHHRCPIVLCLAPHTALHRVTGSPQPPSHGLSWAQPQGWGQAGKGRGPGDSSAAAVNIVAGVVPRTGTQVKPLGTACNLQSAS